MRCLGQVSAAKSGQTLLHSQLLQRQQLCRHPFLHRSTCTQADLCTHRLRVVTASLPLGSSVQLRLTSAATTLGALPMVRAIVDSVSPRLRPASMSTRSW